MKVNNTTREADQKTSLVLDYNDDEYKEYPGWILC